MSKHSRRLARRVHVFLWHHDRRQGKSGHGKASGKVSGVVFLCGSVRFVGQQSGHGQAQSGKVDFRYGGSPVLLSRGNDEQMCALG